MEDASLPTAAHMPSRIQAKVTLTEALGSEIIVHFTFDGQTYVSEDTKLLQKETGEEELHTLAKPGSSGSPPSAPARGCAWVTPSRSRSTSSGPTTSIRRPPRPSVPDPNNARSVP